ncbi:MAG: DUF4349 domain-containing protein [Actinomycetota bacterium]
MKIDLRRGRRLVALVVLVAMAVAACSVGDDDDAATASGDGAAVEFGSSARGSAAAADGAMEAPVEEPADEMADEAAEEEAMDDAASEGGGADTGALQAQGPEPTSPADLGRSIIFVASVNVVVEDVALAASQAKTAIAGLGGLVFGENTTIGGEARTTLEFKVFPQDFQEALTRLEGLGELRSQQITADDVTERVVDLESRITTASASVDRLRGFLETATDSARVAELELQLLERETLLEQLRGQLRTLQDQVDLATIFLTLDEAAPPAVDAIGEYAVTFHEGVGDGSRCPGTDNLRVDEAERFTICVEVTNTGSNPMVGIEVRDFGLDLDPRDFTLIDPPDAVEPGSSVVAYATTEAPAQGFSQISVRADAAGFDGQPLRVGVAFTQLSDGGVEFIEDDSLPGFTDVLGDSWDFFTTVIAVIVLIAAAMIPFLWVPVVVWLVHRWWSRRGAAPVVPPVPPTAATGDDEPEPEPELV